MATDRVTTQSYLDGLLNQPVRVLLGSDLILVGTLVGWDETAVFIQKHDARVPMLISVQSIQWLEPDEGAQPMAPAQPTPSY